MSRSRILITAGPTREPMDPVRYLSNASSGSVGIELAKTLQKKGHAVTLILGPTPLPAPARVKTIPIETALEMQAAVRKKLPATDVFIAAAAVGDWRFRTVSKTKLKKGHARSMTVSLVRNPDILAEAGQKKYRHKYTLIGFALETSNSISAAKKKIKEKKLDLIVANDPSSFSSMHIKPTLIDASGRITRYPRLSKTRFSTIIASWIEAHRNIL